MVTDCGTGEERDETEEERVARVRDVVTSLTNDLAFLFEVNRFALICHQLTGSTSRTLSAPHMSTLPPVNTDLAQCLATHSYKTSPMNSSFGVASQLQWALNMPGSLWMECHTKRLH